MPEQNRHARAILHDPLTYEIAEWTLDGNRIVEVLAKVSDFAIAKAAWEAAIGTRPHDHLIFRQGAHVFVDRKATDKFAKG